MVTVSTKSWPMVALRAAVAMCFGFAFLGSLRATPHALALLFGAYALVDGVATVALAARAPGHARGRGAFFAGGAASSAAGLVALTTGGSSGWALAGLVATWALATGLLTVVAAARWREEVRDDWALGSSGLVAATLGLFLVGALDASTATIATSLAVTLLVSGAILVAAVLRVRGGGRASLHARSRYAAR